MQQLLETLEFRDRTRALDNIAKLSAEIPPGIQELMRYLLTASADPDGALHWLECLHSSNRAAFDLLIHSPADLQVLITVFSYSRFLSEEILQHPEWVRELTNAGELHRLLLADEIEDKLERQLGPDPGAPSVLTLALFRRQQILRILVRDVLAYATLAETTEELSNLADAILNVTYRRIREDLVRRYGTPRCSGEDGMQIECGFSVIALGKLGGRELNYSSDIDLMFVYSGNGQTDGPNPISNKEFFKKVATQFTGMLSTYTAEGMCYRVDLRLRPDGRLGEVCLSLDGMEAYYRTRARDWELQMLIKARVAAGEKGPGAALLAFVEPLIYSTTLDFSAVEAVSLARERIHEKLVSKRTGGEFDVKLAPGGIRDVEFLVQCLQRLHGGREPWVRHGGSLQALFRLRDKDLLSPTEYSRLASAYEFLRNLEHRLQFAEDRQTHVLPLDPEERDLLAHRLPMACIGGDPSADQLLRTRNTHLEEVQEIYTRVIHAQKPSYYTSVPAPRSETQPEEPSAAIVQETASNLVRFLDQTAPGLAATLQRIVLRRGGSNFEHFLEKVSANPEWLGWLDADATLAGYVLDLFEHSSYYAEQMIRVPDLLVELKRMRERPNRKPKYEVMVETVEDVDELRRYFRREMFRIQAESICLRVPIFTTLRRTSELADATIAAAYKMALDHVVASRPPLKADYQPEGQLVVIALGRLGMREFDLGSDADLVFVLRDDDVAEHAFWTRVAERMIDVLTAYTGTGIMFTVDTRLRPNGREGALVQSKRAYKEYFAKTAETWEGITYMKSLAVAGDIERGTTFLNELQDVDWRRYGQSGRSQKKLYAMRMRLEKEQGTDNPLKAGHGGYYDIDFALMYLRLRGAGIFFKVLNTPERIDIIEKMGHLDHNDAVFLNDAATFYRAVDHALRVSSGHTEGSLPHSPGQLEVLMELVTRWTPEHLHDQPVNVELAQIQARTREFFERLFG
jgi:[glutamine synthetase] adenylyltransferase / [glutamine synthetase]-adenylyl-L-tyrosine phosphorylase